MALDLDKKGSLSGSGGFAAARDMSAHFRGEGPARTNSALTPGRAVDMVVNEVVENLAQAAVSGAGPASALVKALDLSGDAMEAREIVAAVSGDEHGREGRERVRGVDTGPGPVAPGPSM